MGASLAKTRGKSERRTLVLVGCIAWPVQNDFPAPMHRPTLRDFRRLTDHAEFSEDDARYDTSGAGPSL